MKEPVKIGVIANLGKPLAQRTLRDLAAAAAARGASLLVDAETAAAVGESWPWPAAQTEDFASVRAVIVLGGDGTMLSAVHRLEDIAAPLLGLNIGSLGYLTGAREDQIAETVESIVAGDFSVSVRQMLSAWTVSPTGERNPVGRDALNEVVLSRGSGRLVRITLELDGVPVTTYACDGVIVSTPTGSTAYSLSAGGPLVMPGSAVTAITVICPHALASRPMVVSDATRVALRPMQCVQPPVLAVDGEDVATIPVGGAVEISRSAKTTAIAFLPGYSDYFALSRKLGWTGSAV